jgi:hypothetical protein
MEIDLVGLARANLRDLARKTEESAVMLDGAGYKVLADELLKVSQLLTEFRQTLESHCGRQIQDDSSFSHGR